MIDEIEELGIGPRAAITGTTYRNMHARAAFKRRRILVQPSTTSGGMVAFTSNMAAWFFDATKKLEALGRLRPGWDSYGGLPLNSKSRTLTIQVLECLGSDELPTPAVVLGSRGDVHLEWRKKGRELEVDLGQGEKVPFVKVHPSGQIEEGEGKADVPEELRELTCWLMHGEASLAP